VLGDKIMVIGSGGAGKSTLARRLGEVTGLPVIHLDKEFWHSGWVDTPREAWRAKQRDLLAPLRWIADGNYGGTMDLRLEHADTVIWLDYSRYLCVFRALRRRVVNWGRVRPDMSEGCPEKIDREFLKWIWQFPKTQRDGIVQRLEQYPSINLMVFHHPAETARFLRGLAGSGIK